MSESEREVALRARSGDREALVELYETHKGRLFALLIRLCGNRQLAEDAFQEVWVKVLRFIETYDPERSPFRAWLFRIARNTTVDLHRRESLRSFPGLETPIDKTGRTAASSTRSPNPGPDVEAQRSATREVVWNAVDSLTEQRRLALLLRHQQGLTFAEVAEVLGVPIGTAKTLTHRGILALRQALSEEGDG